MKVENLLFKEKIPLMNKALDAYSLRMTTSARNIANVNTVGYKPERVKFEELFNEQLSTLQGSTSNTHHIPLGKNTDPKGELQTREVPSAEVMQSGENDLNIDKEMAEIAQTQIRFQFVSQTMNKHFKQLGASITGNSNY
ncbi:MAG: flagellar basal body rod protein FlgB [Ignavibacteria bacterium]|nr:flagellar basal body rod protein FlgB [Ignavibacteria bacterium]